MDTTIGTAKIHGFTLIELLIALAIIGILSSVVLVALSGAREKANISRFKAVVHSMQTRALEACDNGAIDYTNGTGSFGSIPLDINAAGIVDNGQDCGPNVTQTFNASVSSASLNVVCTATVTETGITTFVGC